MDPLIHTYADIDRLLNWIDTSEQQASFTQKFWRDIMSEFVWENLIFVAWIRGAKKRKGSKPGGNDEIKLDKFIQKHLLEEKKPQNFSLKKLWV